MNSFQRIRKADAAKALELAQLVNDPAAMAARRESATRLHELWASLIPEGTPDITTFYDWADRFSVSATERGIRRTADKARCKRRTAGEQPFTADEAARYAHSTIRNISRSNEVAKPVLLIKI